MGNKNPTMIIDNYDPIFVVVLMVIVVAILIGSHRLYKVDSDKLLPMPIGCLGIFVGYTVLFVLGGTLVLYIIQFPFVQVGILLIVFIAGMMFGFRRLY